MGKFLWGISPDGGFLPVCVAVDVSAGGFPAWMPQEI